MADTRRRIAQTQFLKFVSVGVLSTIVNYLAFLMLFGMGMPYLGAMASGFLLGTLTGFQLNKSWTYDASGAAGGYLPKYMMLYSMSLLLGMGCLWMLVEGAGLDPRPANVLTIGVTTCFNFIGTKFVVFRK